MSQITVPDLGDFHDVEVIDVLVKPGDRIDVDTPLLTLETEKATMDVPSSAAGVVKSVVVKKGDKVSKGSAVLELETEASTTKKEAPAAATEKAAAPDPVAQTAASAPAQPKSQPAAASASEVAIPDLGDFHDVCLLYTSPSPRD